MTETSGRDALYREIGELRGELALRSEEVRQLKEEFAPVLAFPREWRLTQAETAILGALYAAKSGVLSKEALHVAVSGLEVETEPKIVDVFVHKLRTKLKMAAVPLAIETRWGFGYSISPQSRAVVARALAGEPIEIAPAAVPPQQARREAETVQRPAHAADLSQHANPGEDAMPRSQLPAPYLPPPAAAQDELGLAADLIGLARARPQHRDVLVQAARALLDPGAAMPAATVQHRKPWPARAAPSALEPNGDGDAPPTPVLTKSDVTVVAESDGGSVSFRGKSVDLSARQARFLQLLARGMPSPIGREFLRSKVFPACGKESGDQQLSVLTGLVRDKVAPIGLTVATVRGVGIKMEPA